MNMITTYAGQWGLSSEGFFRKDPWYALCGNQVVEHGFGKPPSSFPIETLPDGVVIPALVNAHTHLELSYLKNKIKLNCSMFDFVEQVVKSRGKISGEEKRKHAHAALQHAYERGTYFYNDITNDAEFSRFLTSCVYFHGNRFYELLGFSPQVSTMRLEAAYRILQADKDILITPHSPYGTSPILLQQMNEWSRNSLSIHLLESEQEVLMQEGKGTFVNFLKKMGQYTNYPEFENRSLVEYLDTMGIFQYKNLFLVHLTNASNKDIDYLSEHVPHASWVMCHRSNRFLGLERKNLQKLLDSPLKMLIGTDSLASCPDISILDELASLQVEDFADESVLWQAATYSAYEYFDAHLYGIPYFLFAGAKPSIESIAAQGKAQLLNQDFSNQSLPLNFEADLVFDDDTEMEKF